MLIMRGSLAHSHFRLERWLTHINNIVPHINALSAKYIHFIDLKLNLTPDELKILSNLLDYGSACADEDTENSDTSLIIVAPKLGTTSAWSNKASDLAHHCGLNNVNKIERGILYSLEASTKLTWGDEQAIANLLHDPSFEQIFFNLLDVESIFKPAPQKSTQWFNLLEDGKSALIKANNQLNLGLEDNQIEYLMQIFQALKRNPSDIELKTYSEINKVQQFGRMYIEDSKAENLYAEPVANVYQYHSEILTNVLSTRSYFLGTEMRHCEDIRMESAFGRGADPKAGFCGLSVTHLSIPGFKQAWELQEYPNGISPGLDVILDKPICHSQYNNEFGRPVLGGYCRTYEQDYSLPYILAGGYSAIRHEDIKGGKCNSSMNVVIVGFGADSIIHNERVTSENPEMQRRIQALISSCNALRNDNPIVAVYPIGKGGLAGTLLWLTYHNRVGGEFIFQGIRSQDPNLTPLDIWCNEGHEGYALIITQKGFDNFTQKAIRECTPYTVIGKIIEGDRIRLFDQYSQTFPMDLPSQVLFEFSENEKAQTFYPPVTLIPSYSLKKIQLDEAVLRLLRFPCIADKSYLITICDRTVGGLVVQDPMVGPWQVPVADCMITARDFRTFQGEALALGERIPLTLINPIASARMAIGEAITNITCANIQALSEVRLSLSWTGNFQTEEEKKLLFDAVESFGIELCPALGITITHENNDTVSAPLLLVACAFAPVIDVRQSLTPVLNQEEGESLILFIDLSNGQQRLGQSALLQVFNQISDDVPDLDNPKLLKAFFLAIQQLRLEDKILAYHDRSDGGLFVTLCEMAFASHIGLQLDISELGRNAKSILFNEELGAVIQIRAEDVESVLAELADKGVQNCYSIGTLDKTDRVSIVFNEEVICIYDRVELQKIWSETNYHLQSIRDNPRSAKTQYDLIGDREEPGLNVHLTFDLNEDVTAPMLNLGVRPRVAILREQGVYSHTEMAAAFDRARFECVDVHMNDLTKDDSVLSQFKGLAVCGGFSFGDVLGAGQGWTKRILNTSILKDQFESFFNRTDTFTLGLSNGCQMLSGLKSLIPGAELWPRFLQNYSEQFEARWCLVEVQPSSAVLLANMEGSRLMVPVAHREGRAEFLKESDQDEAIRQKIVSLRYVDNWGRKTKIFPANPNGSTLGITGLTNLDGRVLIMMPHPERAFRTVQYSWHPKTWEEDAPWLRMFQNARKWVD